MRLKNWIFKNILKKKINLCLLLEDINLIHNDFDLILSLGAVDVDNANSGNSFSQVKAEAATMELIILRIASLTKSFPWS